MGILSGSIACTRFNAAVPPEGPDFDAVSFRAIEPGSEVRERAGVIPFEPGAPYEIAKGRYAFRVRIDRRRPDPTAVRERLRELVAAEREATGAPFVGPKKRKELKELAERELIVHQAPRIQVIECALDGAILYVGSTAKAWLGMVLALLRQAEVAADWKAPWLDEAPEADEASEIVVPKEPGQSVLGCRFLRALLEEAEVMVEPETGSVRLATREARVTLAGGVLPELVRYLEDGAEILAAKIHLGTVPLRFDALSYRLSGVQLEPVREEHWTLSLDARLEQLAALWAELDGKYAAVKDRLGAPAAAAPPTVEVAGEAPAEAPASA
jgi:hypothetical protein